MRIKNIWYFFIKYLVGGFIETRNNIFLEYLILLIKFENLWNRFTLLIIIVLLMKLHPTSVLEVQSYVYIALWTRQTQGNWQYRRYERLHIAPVVEIEPASPTLANV